MHSRGKEGLFMDLVVKRMWVALTDLVFFFSLGVIMFVVFKVIELLNQ